MELLSVWSRMIYSSFTQDTNLDIHIIKLALAPIS